MASIVYDGIVDPALLTEYVRAFDNEVLRNQFALERYLPNREIMDLEYRLRSGTFEDVDAAEFRAWDTQPGMGKRQGFSKIMGEIVPIGRQIPLGEEHMLRLRSVLQGGEDSALIQQIYADAERMIRAVQARVEVARGQLLTTGKVTIAENGLAIEADFGLPGTHNVTVATSWLDPTASIISDLLAYQEVYVDDTGVAPAEMLLSTKTFNAMLTNQEFRDVAAFGGTTPIRLTADVVGQILASYNLPVPVIYDTKVRVNGTQTRVIAEDKVVLLPPQGELMGQTFYGVTAEAIKLAGKGLIKQQAMPGVVAVVLENENPVQSFTLAAATAMPVLGNPELLFVVDTVP
jgi:Phage major capsid protein E